MTDRNRRSLWIGILLAAAALLVVSGGRALADEAAAAGTGPTTSADWPQWRGPNRDGKVAGFKAPATWPKALTQKWKVTVGQGDFSAVLVGDKLYVFARQDKDEVTLCLDAAKGTELWRDKYAAPAASGASGRQHAGPRSTPAVADGKVVTMGVGGTLSCLDADKGKLVWRNEQYKGVPRFYTAMSPMIVDGLVIAQVGSESDGGVVALNLADGKEKWKWGGDGPGYASPVLLTADGVKQIVTLTSKKVVGVALSDGKLLWEIDFAPKGMSYNAATPIVDGQTVIFTGQGRGAKAVKIEKKGEGFAATELWSNPETSVKFSTPVLKDGLLFGVTDKGNLFCLDAKTGKGAWIDSAKRGGGYGAVLDAGSVILALPDNGELVAFKPSAKAFEEVAKYKVADTPTYACPVVSGSMIYVKDQDSLILWALE